MVKDNWDIEKAMANVMRSQNREPSVKPHSSSGGFTVDEETLSTCLITLAHIIKNDGDQYLPIFERLKSELDEFRRLQSLKDLAINMADQSSLGRNHHQNAQHLTH